MLRLVAGWMVVNGILMASGWLAAGVGHAPSTPWLSLEAAALAGVLALVPRSRWSRGLAWGSAFVVVAFAAVSLADLVFRVSLGRPLDLSLDLYLLDAVYRLAVGNSGIVRTSLGLIGIAVVAAGTLGAAGWLLSSLPGGASSDAEAARNESRLAMGMVAGAILLGIAGIPSEAIRARFPAPTLTLASEQLSLARTTRAERSAFAAELEAEPPPRPPSDELFARLEGRNVVLAYIESYGMAAFDDPEFAAVVRPSLSDAAERLGAAGVAIATGRLTSPTVGGQSWYAHSSMISGLWIENQLRYQLLLASGRETLIDDFERAGYRTQTVMPAITTAWPEATRIGWDDIHTSQTIPYGGPPFYWVTIPDQFTWSFVGDVLAGASQPAFVEVGLVSSHAPWTPVLPLLDWDDMGDGSVFEPYRRDGYPPEEMWWDVDVLRAAYAESLDYSLESMAGFAEQLLDDRTVLIVSGDHQAAPWVTGADGSEVPVHVMSRDPEMLEPFLEWGFVTGGLPGGGGHAVRMDRFREWFVGAFSGGGG